MTLPDKLQFRVGIPTLGGYLGRQCNSPTCRKYFKVHHDSIREEMFCPYCGDRFRNDALWTPDQLRYVKRKVAQEVMPQLQQEVRDIFSRAFRGSKHIKFKPGGPIRRPPDPRSPHEPDVDSELQCPQCGVQFQVDGIFGYCPSCRSENLLLYDANISIIRQEIRSSPNPARALRHAYADLVSTFETFARKEAERHGIEHGRFQNLDHTRRSFRSTLGVDILEGVSDREIRTLKRIFEKRHVHEHNRGIASERYVREVPEDADLVGRQVPLSEDELEEGVLILRRILERLVDNRPNMMGA
jgi:uncharacterized Zn finger protein (UPF0148 family)